MKGIETSAFHMAQRFVGIKEAAGAASNAHILAMLHLDQKWPKGDDVPWCSAFMNYIGWLLRLPRSKSLRARSWLTVGSASQYRRSRGRFRCRHSQARKGEAAWARRD